MTASGRGGGEGARGATDGAADGVAAAATGSGMRTHSAAAGRAGSARGDGAVGDVAGAALAALGALARAAGRAARGMPLAPVSLCHSRYARREAATLASSALGSSDIALELRSGRRRRKGGWRDRKGDLR